MADEKLHLHEYSNTVSKAPPHRRKICVIVEWPSHTPNVFALTPTFFLVLTIVSSSSGNLSLRLFVYVCVFVGYRRVCQWYNSDVLLPHVGTSFIVIVYTLLITRIGGDVELASSKAVIMCLLERYRNSKDYKKLTKLFSTNDRWCSDWLCYYGSAQFLIMWKSC